MSEQNIWNGSYVLGDTSASTIIAGDGIKVDSSVPGTIRISNDETVLYSTTGDGRNNSFTLSELASNFEYLRFEGIGFNNGPCLTTIQAPTGTENISLTYLYFCANNDGNPLQLHASRFSTTDAKTYTTLSKKFLYWSLDGVTPGGNTTSVVSIKKVVGINRLPNT